MDKLQMLNDIREYLNIKTTVGFAQYLDITTPNMYTWFKRGTFDEKVILAKCPEISAEWLLTGNGEMLKENSNNEIKVNLEGRGIPVYDIDVACGVDSLSLVDERIIGYVDLPYFSKECHIITARGDSMEPIVNGGDKIAVRAVSGSLIVYGQVYIIVTEDYRLLKYVHKHPTDSELLILRSANVLYDDIEIRKKDIIKLLVVEGVIGIRLLL